MPNEPEQSKPVVKPTPPFKPKKDKSPKIKPWTGLKEWKTSSVDRDKPKYSLADLERVYNVLAGGLADAFDELADRDAPNEYRTYISARAQERLRKDGHGQ
jgi:hypothetical protein